MPCGHVVDGRRVYVSWLHGRLHDDHGLRDVRVERGGGVPHRHVQLGDGRVDVSALHGRLLLRDDWPDSRERHVPGRYILTVRNDERMHDGSVIANSFNGLRDMWDGCSCAVCCG